MLPVSTQKMLLVLVIAVSACNDSVTEPEADSLLSPQLAVTSMVGSPTHFATEGVVWEHFDLNYYGIMVRHNGDWVVCRADFDPALEGHRKWLPNGALEMHVHGFADVSVFNSDGDAYDGDGSFFYHFRDEGSFHTGVLRINGTLDVDGSQEKAICKMDYNEGSPTGAAHFTHMSIRLGQECHGEDCPAH